ncbi:Alpha/Beta hydrolase protein [Mycena amicta]|nr:Alpha/Beta hydrolase protein [Mycena amicta]
MHSTLAREHNISVFAYDLRGYGRTADDPTHKSASSQYGRTWSGAQMDDLEWAIQETHRECGDLPLFIMGCSFGGTTVLGLVTDPARKDHPAITSLRGVIGGSATLTLTKPPPAPVVWLLTQIARVQPWMLFPVRNKIEDLSRNKETGAEYEKDPLIGTPGSLKCLSSMLKQGQTLSRSSQNWPKELPVLFVHGDVDTIAAHTVTKKFYEEISAQDKTWITYPGGAHELHNEPDGIREKSLVDIATFIQKHC